MASESNVVKEVADQFMDQSVGDVVKEFITLLGDDIYQVGIAMDKFDRSGSPIDAAD